MVKKKKEETAAAAEEVTRKHGKTGVLAKIAGIKEQARENADAVKKIDTSVKKFQGDIKEQARENADAVAKMNTGIREIKTGIKEIITSIKAKAKEFDTYTKDFYYG